MVRSQLTESRIFGQLLLMYVFRHNPSQVLQNLLPEGWEPWSRRGLQILQDLSNLSPAVAKDAEIASTLYAIAAT